MSAVVLATVLRGDLVESMHHGQVVVVDPAGAVIAAAGDPHLEIFARSCLKPLQGVAMLRAGLDLPDHLLAIACASHDGEPRQLMAVRELLARAGLDALDLQNTADLPAGQASAQAWLRAGRGPESLAQNCSGKHAAMLETCLLAGWPTASYLDPDHPLQRLVCQTVTELTGGAPRTTSVDGCGAPLFSCTLAGLAHAFGTIARAGADDSHDPHDPASHLGRVARAMNGHPDMVGGIGRDVTDVMAALPGVLAKDGAEGVLAVGLPDGRGIAVKVTDGSGRPRPVLLAAMLRAAGFDHPVLERLGQVDVLGHGLPVGSVRASLPAELLAALAAG